MREKKRIKLKKQLANNLKVKYYKKGLGRSKHTDKKAYKNGKTKNMPDVIYSKSTLDSYLKNTNKFVDFCYAHDVRTIEGAMEMAPQYLQQEIDRGMSASTIHLKASAIAKALDCNYKDFGVNLPARERADYVRSRNVAARDSGFSLSKNKELIDFCQGSGLRRAEVTKIRGCDIFSNDNGVFCKVYQGKGGKDRVVKMYATNEVKQATLTRASEQGEKPLFDHIPTNMDIHSYRSDYAVRVYNTNKRDIDKLPEDQLYRCRKDRLGDVFDRQAMMITSNELGHNRISVIAQSYLR